ncbi:MAG: crotonase [Desulfuromonas sp.]|nr:MAG: crotonase [Desulfuromonas sp.]
MATKQAEQWKLEQDDSRIAWLTLDRTESSANTLGRQVLEELDQKLAEIEEMRPKAVVIRSGKPGGFIAGADIKEFTEITDRDQAETVIRRSQQIFSRLEDLPMPTIAMIHGFCLGGGLELSLACRYRIASDDPGTRLGLPEVLLGIHPGFGGSVRLPRLIGPLGAMSLMLAGRTVTARSAKKLGLVDYAVAERHLENGARSLAENAPPKRRLPLRERLAALPLAKPWVAKLLRRNVAKKVREDHYPAPYRLIDLWLDFGRDEAANYNAEAASVAELITGETARNLVRVFLLQEQMKSLGRSDASVPQWVHVIGGGTMGGDIANWCALQGMTVTIQDLDPERLGQVVKRAATLFRRKLKQESPVRNALDRLIPDPDGHGVAKADLVIEAIFEDADTKRELYRQIEPRMREDALLASNTSSIPLEELAKALKRPERLLGLHFFNPVAKMQLVEVISGPDTKPEHLQRGAAFVHAIKRLPLPVKGCPGFLVNRILMPYLLEAVTLVEEGVDPAVIDQAATDFGMPMGPVRLADTVGLDICLSVARILANHYPIEVPGKLESMVADKRLGRKSGRGFYDYGSNDKKSSNEGVAVPTEVTDRLILRLLNEVVACWREEIAEDADLLDAGIIFGTGFAPFRGGPMHHITTSGPEQLASRLRELEQNHGSRFTPDAGWEELSSK